MADWADEKAQAIDGVGRLEFAAKVAAALREERRTALESAARYVESFRSGAPATIAAGIRALASAGAPEVGKPAQASLRDVAAFLLDRADQYDTDSPCWIALADAASDVVAGEVAAREQHGEFDAALYERVDRIASKGLGQCGWSGYTDNNNRVGRCLLSKGHACPHQLEPSEEES